MQSVLLSPTVKIFISLESGEKGAPNAPGAPLVKGEGEGVKGRHSVDSLSRKLRVGRILLNETKPIRILAAHQRIAADWKKASFVTENNILAGKENGNNNKVILDAKFYKYWAHSTYIYDRLYYEISSE